MDSIVIPICSVVIIVLSMGLLILVKHMRAWPSCAKKENVIIIITFNKNCHIEPVSLALVWFPCFWHPQRPRGGQLSLE